MLFQDLGGIRNRQGLTLRPHRLLRSRCFYHARASAIRDLERHHVGLVLDLRTQAEIQDRPDALPTRIPWHNIPVFSEATVGITRERHTDYIAMLRGMRDIASLYGAMVSDPYCLGQLSRILHVILAQQEGAVLYHCTAGKDRTGIITWLLLTLLDVDDETIMVNYLSVNRRQKYVAAGAAALSFLCSFDKKLARKAYDYFCAKADYLRSAIEVVNARCGSTAAFLRDELGITEEEKQAFRARLLV